MKERLLKKIGRVYSWYNHGNGLLNPARDFLTISANVMILAGNRFLAYTFAISAMLLFVFSGLINSYFGFRRFQNEYEADLTPQIKSIAEDIKTIKDKLNGKGS